MRKKKSRKIGCAFLHFSGCGAAENGEFNYRFARADFLAMHIQAGERQLSSLRFS